jgi:23S rRNA (adenine2503-C2)-methyltransferase
MDSAVDETKGGGMNWNQIRCIDSKNENVWKYVFEKEGAVAEAVLYRYPTFEHRTVICCSTQSGCPVGCRFCGAGDSFVRSLSSGEIVSQVQHLLGDKFINPEKVGRLQIMFMSMGEPLLNFTETAGAIRRLRELYPKSVLLLSTSAPRVDYGPVRALSVEVPSVGLQFSVHESTDEARDRLIPFRAKLTLEEIATEGERWALATGRRPFFNYCAHAGNVSDEDVSRMYGLFNPAVWECTVSVVCEREESVAAANERQRELAAGFMEKMQAKGYSCRKFDPAGQDDIGGGCGQLWFVQEWMRNHPESARASVGRGMPEVHAPRPEPEHYKQVMP